MTHVNDSPEEESQGKQKPTENQDNSKHETRPESKKHKEKHKEDDKFSPGEPDDYNAEEFSTD